MMGPGFTQEDYPNRFRRYVRSIAARLMSRGIRRRVSLTDVEQQVWLIVFRDKLNFRGNTESQCGRWIGSIARSVVNQALRSASVPS
jgi:hypothetical protein